MADVYIFLPIHIGEVPAVAKIPITINASSDEEARKQIEKMGPGELFKKIPREIKTLEKKKKNGLFKK